MAIILITKDKTASGKHEVKNTETGEVLYRTLDEDSARFALRGYEAKLQAAAKQEQYEAEGKLPSTIVLADLNARIKKAKMKKPVPNPEGGYV